MLDSDFEVFPLGAEIDSAEFRTKLIVKSHLAISLQRLVYCRYHHFQVVLSRYFALCQNSHYVVGKVFDNLDHDPASPALVEIGWARGNNPCMAIAVPRRISLRTISALIRSFIK